MNLKEKAISGAKWTTISTVIVALVQMFRLMVLARFLDKAEFGIVAIITFVLGLTYTFSDIGFSAGIMHKKEIDEKDFSSLFWVQFLIFFVIYILLSCSSPLIASFYNEHTLSYLIPIALFDLVLAGIGKLYDTILQKTMQFKIIAIRNIISALCSVMVAIVLAILGFGIYSMILSTLSQTLINHLWNFIAGQKEYRINYYCSVTRIKPYFKIGIFQTGTQVIDYFSSKLDILIIGKFMGTENLGIYNLAKEMILKLILVINSIVNRVALPVLSYNNTNNAILQTQYCKMLNLLSTVNFPICVFLGVFSSQIVILFYGHNYIDVAPLVSVLSIYSIFHSIGNPVGNLAIAKGRTDISFQYVIVRSIISIIIVITTALYSIQIVAWGQVILIGIMFFVGWKMLINKLIQLPLLIYIKSFFTNGIIALIIGLIFGWIVHSNILYINNLIFQLIFYGGIFLLVYVVVIFFSYKEKGEAINLRKKNFLHRCP